VTAEKCSQSHLSARLEANSGVILVLQSCPEKMHKV